MNTRQILTLVCVAVCSIGLSIATARADIIAYQVPAGTAGNQAFDGPVGMDFNVNQPILVTQLGVFDDGSNGLNRDLTAYLYDRGATAAPLETLPFSGADPGSLVDGSRFKPLAAARVLPSGFQGTVVGENYGAGESFTNSHGAPPVWTTNDGGGAISFVGTGRFGTTQGAYPPTGDGGPNNRYAAGTFTYRPTQIAYQIPAGTVGNQAFDGPLGMDFDTSVPIEISHLGVFDSGSDGLNRAINAYVYDRTTQQALAALSFATGSGDMLADGSRYQQLSTPLILPAGFQGTIVAENYGTGEPNGNNSSASPPWTTDTSGVISFVGTGRFGVTQGAFPGTADGGPTANKYAAGTFLFTRARTWGDGISTSIPVPNGSFEDPSHGSPGGFATSVPGWTTAGAGNWYPSPGDLSDPIPDGKQVAFINSGSLTSDPLGETLEADTLYVLDVAWGRRASSTATPGYTMALNAGGTTLGWVNSTTLGNGPTPEIGTFASVRGYFTANHNAALGSDLQIYLSGGNPQIAFDNVRLTKITDAAVPLVNPSFEDPVLSVSFSDTVTGWAEAGPGGGVFKDPDEMTPADGLQTAFIRGGGSFTQTLTGLPLENDRLYVLMVEVANRASVPTAGYQVELLAGETTIAIDDNSVGVPGAGAFLTTSVVSFLSGSDNLLAGQNLGIRLTALGTGNETYFDNVRLFAVAVPEPSAIMLSLLGLVAVVGFGRRRRQR